MLKPIYNIKKLIGENTKYPLNTDEQNPQFFNGLSIYMYINGGVFI
jgi:hypothetical protein